MGYLRSGCNKTYVLVLQTNWREAHWQAAHPWVTQCCTDYWLLAWLQLTLPHDLFSGGVGTTTLHHSCKSCNGWESSSRLSLSSQYSSSATWMAWLRRTCSAIYNVCQTWQLVDACVRRQRRRLSSYRHAFLLSAIAPSPLPWRGHRTVYRHHSHRYLHWRLSGVSWRRNCSPEAFLIPTALPPSVSDRYFAGSAASHSYCFVLCL